MTIKRETHSDAGAVAPRGELCLRVNTPGRIAQIFSLKEAPIVCSFFYRLSQN